MKQVEDIEMDDVDYRERNTSETHINTLHYMKTIPALLKMIEILFSLLGFICIASYYKATFFVLVCMAAVVGSVLLMFFYLFRLSDQYLNSLTWKHCEFIFYALWSLLYLIASTLIVTLKINDNLFISAAIFGYAAMVAYATDAFFKWRAVHGCVIDSGAHATSEQSRNSSESTESS